MASKRIFKSTVDWTTLASRFPQGQKQDFLVFKAKSDGYLRKAMSNPEEPPKIDWSYYKANIANKAIVEQFEKSYNALKLPYPEDKGSYAKIDEDKKRMAADVEVYIKNSNARIKKYQDELDRFAKVMPIEEMSGEEYAYYYPNERDEIAHPMNWPEIEEAQESPEEIMYWKKRGVYYPYPDHYHPNLEEEVKKLEEAKKLPQKAH